MVEQIYWFSATIQQGRMGKTCATIDNNKNICAVKSDPFQAYLMMRHELYHYLARHQLYSFSLATPSIFTEQKNASTIHCLIDINLQEYGKKNKKFHRKSRFISTITGKRQWDFELIGTYRKQYVYPAKLMKQEGGFEVRFLDFGHEVISAETEIDAILKSRLCLYRQIEAWKQQKAILPVASTPFGRQTENNTRITLIDVEMKQFKHASRNHLV